MLCFACAVRSWFCAGLAEAPFGCKLTEGTLDGFSLLDAGLHMIDVPSGLASLPIALSVINHLLSAESLTTKAQKRHCSADVITSTWYATVRMSNAPSMLGGFDGSLEVREYGHDCSG